MKNPPEHKDLFGKPLSVGDFVIAIGEGERGLRICQIIKLTPQMVKIQKIASERIWCVYSINTVLLNPEDVTLYALSLKNQNTNWRNM
jgi:hypothetical protein